LQVASTFIGMGIGLFADELGLLLNCTTADRECVYAFPDAFDVVVFVTAAIIILIIMVGLLDKYALRKARLKSLREPKEK
jgi:hypothetical protein